MDYRCDLVLRLVCLNTIEDCVRLGKPIAFNAIGSRCNCNCNWEQSSLGAQLYEVQLPDNPLAPGPLY